MCSYKLSFTSSQTVQVCDVTSSIGFNSAQTKSVNRNFVEGSFPAFSQVPSKHSPALGFMDFFQSPSAYKDSRLLIFVNCSVAHFYQNPVFWVEKVFIIPLFHLRTQFVRCVQSLHLTVEPLPRKNPSVFWNFDIAIFYSCFGGL